MPGNISGAVRSEWEAHLQALFFLFFASFAPTTRADQTHHLLASRANQALGKGRGRHIGKAPTNVVSREEEE